MLNSKIWTAAVSSWMAVTFTICVLSGVIAPGLPISHRTLEILLPGFTWISPTAFLLGLVESVFYGAYMALLFVWLHNFFVRRFGVARQTSTPAKAA